MSGNRILAAAAAAVLTLIAGTVKAAPVDAYGALPAVEHVVISPDGSKFAYVVLYKGHQAVMVATTGASSKIVAEAPGTEQKVRELVWADSERLIIIKSQTSHANEVISARSEWYIPYVFEPAKRTVRPLLRVDTEGEKSPDMMNVMSGQVQARRVDGHPVVYVQGASFVDSRTVAALFKIDLESERQQIVERALSSSDQRDWLVGPDGTPLAQVTYSQETHKWTLRLRRAGAWADVYQEADAIDTPSLEGVSPDGAALLLRVPTAKGYQTKVLSLVDGKLAPSEAYDGIEAFIADPATFRIIGGVRAGADGDQKFFAKADQAAWDAILDAFPGEEVELTSWSDDRRKMVLRVTGQAHGVAYLLVDLDTHKAVKLADAYDGIGPNDVAASESITYKAADGRSVPAYLTLPNGKDAKTLPLVVLPHGGPEAHDEPGFDWWAQALASRGYAVLQPQFRGSDGFGQEWTEAGYGEFGRKMQSDVSDGVRALVHSGIADPKRVCVVGASYGGYAALAGVTLESGVYRCAVAVAGISDLRKMWGGSQADPSKNSSLRFWDRFTGVKDPNDPKLDEFSPIKHIDKITVPVLVIHGKDDTVVPFDQSQRMVDAMKAAGKPVEFVVLKSEDHWLSRTETRQQMLDETVKFLETNNPPG